MIFCNTWIEKGAKNNWKIIHFVCRTADGFWWSSLRFLPILTVTHPEAQREKLRTQSMYQSSSCSVHVAPKGSKILLNSSFWLVHIEAWLLWKEMTGAQTCFTYIARFSFGLKTLFWSCIICPCNLTSNLILHIMWWRRKDLVCYYALCLKEWRSRSST